MIHIDMKSRSALPILFFSLLSCLSLAFSSPIPARAFSPDDLAQQSTDHSHHEARSLASQEGELPFEKRILSTFRQVAQIAKGAVRLKSTTTGPTVSMTRYAKGVIKASGQNGNHYPGGVDPEKAHVDVTTQHYAGRPNIDKVKITAPFHEGGKGDKVRPPDPKNHLVAQPYSKGKALPKEHVYAPAGFPKVEQHHFKQYIASVGKTKVKIPQYSAKAKGAAKAKTKSTKATSKTQSSKPATSVKSAAQAAKAAKPAAPKSNPGVPKSTPATSSKGGKKP